MRQMTHWKYFLTNPVLALGTEVVQNKKQKQNIQDTKFCPCEQCKVNWIEGVSENYLSVSKKNVSLLFL